MVMTKGKWITVALGSLAVAGLWWGYRQINLLYQYAFKIKRVSVGDANSNKLDVALDIEFTNKSSIGFDINGYSLDVYINDIFVSKIKSATTQTVKGDGTAMLSIPISLSLRTILNAENLLRIAAALANLKTAVLKIKGVVSIKSGIVNATDAPIEYSETIANLMKPKETK